ncbi:MMPL family transporter, partial [Mycobacterium kansasii]
VQDLLADPVTAGQAMSQDGKAWYVPVGVAGTLGDPRAAESVRAVRAIVAESFSGTSTIVRVTGPPATFSDLIDSAEQDLIGISIV